MEGKTIFIVIGVLMIVVWTFREGLKGLRSGHVEKSVKGSDTPVIITRAKDSRVFWSYIVVYFGIALGALVTGIWLLFLK